MRIVNRLRVNTRRGTRATVARVTGDQPFLPLVFARAYSVRTVSAQIAQAQGDQVEDKRYQQFIGLKFNKLLIQDNKLRLE